MDTQTEIGYPLAAFGYKRPSFWLWRRWRWAYVFVVAIKDIWLIASGRMSLHQAWQIGYDQGCQAEYHRTVIMGGR